MSLRDYWDMNKPPRRLDTWSTPGIRNPTCQLLRRSTTHGSKTQAVAMHVLALKHPIVLIMLCSCIVPVLHERIGSIVISTSVDQVQGSSSPHTDLYQRRPASQSC